MALEWAPFLSFARRGMAAGVLLACIVPAAKGAQSAPPGKPSFAAASVRANKSGARPGGIRPLANGRLTATNVTLRELILRAYGLHDSQLVEGPTWMDADRFDIAANTEAPPAAGISAVMAMLQTVLMERFALRTHTEKRTLPTYVLLPFRADGKPGQQLRLSTIDCLATPVSAVPGTAQPNAQGWPPCGLALVRTTVGKVRTRVEGKHSAVTMQEFATSLQTTVGRPVVDRTGFAGQFDVAYSFSVENPSAAPAAATQLADLPDTFTAFQEQLGLKLDAQQNLVDVLVVDAVAQPTAN